MGQKEHLNNLFKKYFNKTASADERIELMQLINDTDSDEALHEAVDQIYSSFEPEKSPFDNSAGHRMLQNIKAGTRDKGVKGSRISRLYGSRIFRYGIAATLLFFIGFGTYFFVNERKDQQLAKMDFVPGGNNAILTLSNGAKIILNNAGNGTLAQQDGVAINKMHDGEVAYSASEEVEDVSGQNNASFNTLTTPKGGQYEIVLADGTKAWLNSVSSIRFPTSFPGKERLVEITGEVYFEVAKNRSKPFFVKAGNQIVRVLGTHFNINSYADEPEVRTTLVEGAVEIKRTAGGSSVILKPGQQATLRNSGPILVDKCNIEQAIAWKNGYFQIDDADIATIMRQAARWYNVEIVYQGQIPKRQFSGKIPKNIKASEFLQMLTYFNVHFDIEGQKIIVKN